MTGEEMERAIEFILQNQATLEERIEQTQAQIAETNRIVQMQATSQSEFNQTVTTAITALADGQQRLTESQRQFAESQRELAESQQRLADSILHTDRKLDALIDIVRERLEGEGGG